VSEGQTASPANRRKKRWEGFSMAASTSDTSASDGAQYELCFHSRVDRACAFAFPCDAAGRVNLDALSEQARRNYLFARMVVGPLFLKPAVRPTAFH
jgi:hypothetical protein